MRNKIITKVIMTLIVIGLPIVFFGVDTHFAKAIYEPKTTIDTSANINTVAGPSRVLKKYLKIDDLVCELW